MICAFLSLLKVRGMSSLFVSMIRLFNLCARGADVGRWNSDPLTDAAKANALTTLTAKTRTRDKKSPFWVKP